MKEFIKYVFATVAGIILFGFILMFIVIAGIIGLMTLDSEDTKAAKGSVLVLNLEGTINERADQVSPLSIILDVNDIASLGLDDLLEAIKEARDNDNIVGIYVEAGVMHADSPATLQALHDALSDFRKSGKWIVAYADNFLQGAYYVCSVADKIYLNPSGMLSWQGLGGRPYYLKNLYEKIGVRYQVTRVGKYKSAVEHNTETHMSDADREQTMAYLSNIWSVMVSDVARSRGIDPDDLNRLADDSIMAFADPSDYVEARLVDCLSYPDEMKREIKKRLNIDDDDDIPLITPRQLQTTDKEDGEERIAVYYAVGEIFDTDVSGITGSVCIAGDRMSKDMEEMKNDDEVKAVVLRVNSPGGSAYASEQIWHAVKSLSETKPVVVSMGGYAASGGYYISSAANYIIAEPTTITGSIGIFGMLPNCSALLTDKLGIDFDEVKTNKYSNFEANLVIDPQNDETMAFMQNYVDRGYRTFLNRVATGRHSKAEKIDEIGGGRVWTGGDAVRINLVDSLGNLDDAVEKAARLARLENYHTDIYPVSVSWIEKIIMSDNEETGNNLDELLMKRLGILYKPIMELKTVSRRNPLQARLPFIILSF